MKYLKKRGKKRTCKKKGQPEKYIENYINKNTDKKEIKSAILTKNDSIIYEDDIKYKNLKKSKKKIRHLFATIVFISGVSLTTYNTNLEKIVHRKS